MYLSIHIPQCNAHWPVCHTYCPLHDSSSYTTLHGILTVYISLKNDHHQTQTINNKQHSRHLRTCYHLPLFSQPSFCHSTIQYNHPTKIAADLCESFWNSFTTIVMSPLCLENPTPPSLKTLLPCIRHYTSDQVENSLPIHAPSLKFWHLHVPYAETDGIFTTTPYSFVSALKSFWKKYHLQTILLRHPLSL